MVTKAIINNFKKLDNVVFPFSQSLVIIGPNNAGKSTVFQALCLWEIGVKNYIAAFQKRDLDGKGHVVINRKDLLNSPISDARFLWRNKIVTKHSPNKTEHIKLEIELNGENDGENWACRVEFTFTNAESFTCRVVSGFKEMTGLYENDKGVHFGFLQPMSGIATLEDKLQQGAIDRRLGEGKTAEVLRNICYEVLFPETKRLNTDPEKNWKKLCTTIKQMFGAELMRPEFIKINGTIQLEYIEKSEVGSDIKYDISSGGRGFQQTLLLLAFMYASPNTILLLDEPDAHLEVIRQKEIFHTINNVAYENNTQIVIVSHSEVVLTEAAESSKVIALIENQAVELNTAPNSQSLRNIKKALTEIGWEKYYLAKSKGHVLYLEGSTDLQMLLQFANRLQHKVEPFLRFANVDYTGDNVPNTAVQRTKSLKEVFPKLKALALFDKINKNTDDIKDLNVICWQRRELENYFATPSLLIKHAGLLSHKYQYLSSKHLQSTMEECIELCTLKLYLNDLSNEWWSNEPASKWLELVMQEFYKRLNLPQDFYKTHYYQLISLMKKEDIDTEITVKLDLIYDLLRN